MKSKNPILEREWMNEFKEFISIPSLDVPQTVTRSICDRIKRDLCPSIQRVFTKAFFAHLLAAGITLLFCPQFGIGPLGGGHGLMGFYMTFGTGWCATFCGATFLGLSSLVTTIALSKEQLRVANVYGYAYIPLITAFSFGLLMLGGESADMQFALLWNLGALVAGYLLFKIGISFKLRTLSF